MCVAIGKLLPVVAIGTFVAYVSAVRIKIVDGVRMQKKRGFEFNQVGTELNVKLGRAHNKEAPEGAMVHCLPTGPGPPTAQARQPTRD